MNDVIELRRQVENFEFQAEVGKAAGPAPPSVGNGDDTVGSPHRAQLSQFELFELILLLKLDKQFPVEQFEATVSQSKVPSPSLSLPVSRPHAAQSLGLKT